MRVRFDDIETAERDGDAVRVTKADGEVVEVVSSVPASTRMLSVALLDRLTDDAPVPPPPPSLVRGEAPVAFVKLKAGMTADEHELKQFLAKKINKLEMPREIIFKDALPKTLIGKLSKKELREEYAAHQKHGHHHEPA